MKISKKYLEQKAAAIYTAKGPTLTDQSQANDTDINVIVKRYARTGTAPGAKNQPIYEDFTQLPNDLRTAIECARGLADAHAKLPDKLKALTHEQLFALTRDQIESMLKPEPTDKPADPPEGVKKE